MDNIFIYAIANSQNSPMIDHQMSNLFPSRYLQCAHRCAPPATPKFDSTCDELKVCGLVFDSADPLADRFTHVKRKIYEYIGK